MNNIARILKETVQRVARKQVRAETHALRKVSGQNRKGIADISARMREIERKVALLLKQVPPATLGSGQYEAGNVRFSAKGLQSLRKRLGLSATECGILVGVTGRTVGKWERGEARPEEEQLVAVAELRKIGKREARMRVDELARKQR